MLLLKGKTKEISNWVIELIIKNFNGLLESINGLKFVERCLIAFDKVNSLILGHFGHILSKISKAK